MHIRMLFLSKHFRMPNAFTLNKLSI
ncbi:hypothetical protein Gotur_010741 [Gossypium turneri]